jgi:hypothetical protein
LYPIIEIPQDAPEATEPVGSKPNFWFTQAELGKCLFKEVRPGTGEDWAEKVAAEFGAALHLPHASYEFAAYQGKRGVITPSFAPPDCRLVLGNELLARVEPAYDIKKVRSPQHTLSRVLAVVKDTTILVPLGWDPILGVDSPLGVFTGYLMFDAWLGNQDRHHQNWGVVVSAELQPHLAPSFDHGSSLGRNETDQVRTERLETADQGRSVENYVNRARSAFFSTGGGRLSTIDTFREAATFRPAAAKVWLDRLDAVSLQQIRGIFDNVPGNLISGPAIEFAVRMLQLNKERLLELRGTL